MWFLSYVLACMVNLTNVIYLFIYLPIDFTLQINSNVRLKNLEICHIRKEKKILSKRLFSVTLTSFRNIFWF